jgi:hypothetical protein
VLLVALLVGIALDVIAVDATPLSLPPILAPYSPPTPLKNGGTRVNSCLPSFYNGGTRFISKVPLFKGDARGISTELDSLTIS